MQLPDWTNDLVLVALAYLLARSRPWVLPRQRWRFPTEVHEPGVAATPAGSARHER